MENEIDGSARHVLLTGKPGCGKSTVIMRSVSGRRGVGGFYTREIRESGKRAGFSINTIDGRRGVLAGSKIRSDVRVGRYGVNLRDLDDIAVGALEYALGEDDIRVVVIDEIASMEMASVRFRAAVMKALDSDKHVLGTIQMRDHPFLDAIRRRKDVSVVEVNATNRGRLPGLISEWLERLLG